jgi:hypothetical protein
VRGSVVAIRLLPSGCALCLIAVHRNDLGSGAFSRQRRHDLRISADIAAPRASSGAAAFAASNPRAAPVAITSTAATAAAHAHGPSHAHLSASNHSTTSQSVQRGTGPPSFRTGRQEGHGI